MMTNTQSPPWFTAALVEIGAREQPENRGPVIRRYIALAKCGAEGEPWCAIFVNAMLEQSGIQGTRSAWSQSFVHDGDFVQLSGPALGAIAVFYRDGKESGLGHVGFYCGESLESVYTLGGNEHDMVQIEPLPKNGARFGLWGYWWPRKFVLPEIKPVAMAGGAVTAPPKVT